MCVNFADYSYMSKKYQESQKALEKAVKVRNDATLEASKHIENNIKLQKEIVTLTARNTKLEGFVNELIEVGYAMLNSMIDWTYEDPTPEADKFCELARDWKEG